MNRTPELAPTPTQGRKTFIPSPTVTGYNHPGTTNSQRHLCSLLLWAEGSSGPRVVLEERNRCKAQISHCTYASNPEKRPKGSRWSTESVCYTKVCGKLTFFKVKKSFPGYSKNRATEPFIDPSQVNFPTNLSILGSALKSSHEKGNCPDVLTHYFSQTGYPDSQTELPSQNCPIQCLAVIRHP